MNSLARIGKFKYYPLIYRSYSSNFLGETGWYPKIKPGPYPKTEEEKCAAAKKYGLLREEYEPYDDNGDGYGDYPKVKMESLDVKSYYYPWNDTYNKRLYSETLNVYHPVLTYDRFSTGRKKFSFSYVLRYILGTCFIIVAPCLYLNNFKQHHRVLKKQYPEPNVVHYTFELYNEDAEQLPSGH